jgi:hypothetical protein
MDQDERPSDPYFPSGPSSSDRGVRPMSYMLAVGWSLATSFLFFFMASAVASLRPSARIDLITSFGCQAASTLLGLYLILRMHAPEASIGEFLGMRVTHVAFFVLALGLGVSLQLPVNELNRVIEARWPVPPDAEQNLLESVHAGGPILRGVTGLVLVGLGPLLEEVFFRGALYRPLRKRYGAGGIVIVTAALFAVAHAQWQVFLPIFLVGASVGFLRAASGSLLPGVLLHATFNAVPFWSLLRRDPNGPEGVPEAPASITLTLGSLAATFLLLGLVSLLAARSELAREARRKDQA